MKINIKGSILVYVLVIINITLVIAYVIFANTENIGRTLQTEEIRNSYEVVLQRKAQVSYDIMKSVNSDGGGFSDTIGCPQTIDIKSEYFTGVIDTSYFTYRNNTAACEFSYDSNTGSILFLEDFSGFQSVHINNQNIVFKNNFGVLTANSLDTLLTIDDFGPDQIDDNMNNDDYTASIFDSGSLDTPSLDIHDNDENYRLQLFGYIGAKKEENIYLLDKEYKDFLAKISVQSFSGVYEVGKPTFLFEFDNHLGNLNYDISLLKFDTNLRLVERSDYRQLTGSTYSLPIDVDMDNFQYALLLKNNTTNAINYTISAYDQNQASLYLNAVDAKENFVEIFENTLLKIGGQYTKKSKKFLFDI